MDRLRELNFKYSSRRERNHIVNNEDSLKYFRQIDAGLKKEWK